MELFSRRQESPDVNRHGHFEPAYNSVYADFGKLLILLYHLELYTTSNNTPNNPLTGAKNIKHGTSPLYHEKPEITDNQGLCGSSQRYYGTGCGVPMSQPPHRQGLFGGGMGGMGMGGMRPMGGMGGMGSMGGLGRPTTVIMNGGPGFGHGRHGYSHGGGRHGGGMHGGGGFGGGFGGGGFGGGRRGCPPHGGRRC